MRLILTTTLPCDGVCRRLYEIEAHPRFVIVHQAPGGQIIDIWPANEIQSDAEAIFWRQVEYAIQAARLAG